MSGPPPPSEVARIGLCPGCRHGRQVVTRSSRFWLCERWATDPRYEKYPRLPVLACPGYEPAGE